MANFLIFLLGSAVGAFLVLLHHWISLQLREVVPRGASHKHDGLKEGGLSDAPRNASGSQDSVVRVVKPVADEPIPTSVPTLQRSARAQSHVRSNLQSPVHQPQQQNQTSATRTSLSPMSSRGKRNANANLKPPMNLGEPNIFISLALKGIKDASDIVLFSGKTTKRLLDQPLRNLTALVSLNGKVRTSTWRDIAKLVNNTYYDRGYDSKTIKGVHVHNEHKFG